METPQNQLETWATLDPRAIAYVAGIFDGEGCISISKKKVRPGSGSVNPSHALTVRVASTDLRLPLYLQGLFGGSITTHEDKRSRHRTHHAWSTGSRRAASFLRLILEHLIVKKDEARVALEFAQRMKYSPRLLSGDELSIRDQYQMELTRLKGRINGTVNRTEPVQ